MKPHNIQSVITTHDHLAFTRQREVAAVYRKPFYYPIIKSNKKEDILRCQWNLYQIIQPFLHLHVKML